MLALREQLMHWELSKKNSMLVLAVALVVVLGLELFLCWKTNQLDLEMEGGLEEEKVAM
jgi:Tfp pilus assembly protein PilO